MQTNNPWISEQIPDRVAAQLTANWCRKKHISDKKLSWFHLAILQEQLSETKGACRHTLQATKQNDGKMRTPCHEEIQ